MWLSQRFGLDSQLGEHNSTEPRALAPRSPRWCWGGRGFIHAERLHLWTARSHSRLGARRSGISRAQPERTPWPDSAKPLVATPDFVKPFLRDGLLRVFYRGRLGLPWIGPQKLQKTKDIATCDRQIGQRLEKGPRVWAKRRPSSALRDLSHGRGPWKGTRSALQARPNDSPA